MNLIFLLCFQALCKFELSGYIVIVGSYRWYALRASYPTKPSGVMPKFYFIILYSLMNVRY